MSEKAELKPCPHCGNSKKPTIMEWDGEGFPGYVVRCDASGFDGQKGRGCGASGGWGEDPTEAAAVWNRRALQDERDGGWQDISTCPENVSVQIHIPHLDYYGNNGVYAGMLVNMGTGKRWMTFGHAIGRDLGLEDHPTAWRPLPRPPHSKDSEG